MKIVSKIKDYTYEFSDNVFSKKDILFKPLKYDHLFYFVDENVAKLYGKKLKKFIGDDFCLIIPATEKNKEYLKLVQYYRALIKARFTRNDILVTFGGGILQDISGFISSTLYRGIKWVFFPTTLLAQADSCIGSKTSVNFDGSKNLIGTFYPPDIIYIDTSFCNTLSDEYFNSGLGEIIKFHFLSDNQKYKLLKKYLAGKNLCTSPYFKNIVQSTLAIKKSYFQEDEFDTGRRNLLNYGHCFGHALEAASDFVVSHGEAVIMGMRFANLLSLRRNLMAKQKYEDFEEILQRYSPKVDLSKIDVRMLINFLKRDKKRIGEDLTMVLSADIGKQYKFNDIKESEIIDTYRQFTEVYRNCLR